MTPPPTPLACAQVVARLDDFVDRELSALEMQLVREHLEVCDHCARAHRFEAMVVRSIKQRLRRIEIPAELRARLLAALES